MVSLRPAGRGAGVTRPGALERHLAGISTKVLSDRFRKLTAYGVLSKQVYAEVPPRTEYARSPTGQKLVHSLAQLNGLDEEIRLAEPCAPADATKRRQED